MKKIFALFFFSLSALSSATTYYLSPEGNDLLGNGSIENPWFTLNKAWAIISAGDTIYMRGGTYVLNSPQILTGKNGTAGKFINVWAYSGENPILTKSVLFNYTVYCGVYFKGNYCHFKKLEIKGYEQITANVWSGLRVEDSNNNIFELLNIHQNGHGCVITGNSDKNLVLNCDFHHNQDPLTPNKYDNADGLEICYIPSGVTNLVKGCRFWWNTDDGLDLWENDGFVSIDSCWSWNNGYIPDTFTPAGDGNGFKFGKTVTDHNNAILRTIRNCISFNNKGLGFDQNEALCGMELFNNTSYRNKINGFKFVYHEIICKVKNCISYENVMASVFTKASTLENNTFLFNGDNNTEHLISDDDFISRDETQLLMLREANGNLPSIDFMHLSSESDLIDKGVDVGLPYQGEAPDIGAFEAVVGDFHLNKLPVVTISFPTKGISFESPASITVNVEAYDPDGSISKVELYNGSKKLAEITVAPYSFTLKDLPAGSYDLKAVATDNLNASAASAALEVSVVAINENSEYFNLYPNPNNGHFTVDFTTLAEADIFTVTIVDLIGKTVYSEELSKDESTRQFDLSHLENGIYVLMISAKQILLTQKFIKG